MTKYEYEDFVYAELARVLKGLFPPRTPLQRASRERDLAGIDAEYLVNDCCPLALRVRFNRPAWAADADITFRTTEPRMIADQTYADLAVFAWFTGHQCVAAKLIDVYRMAERLEPPLTERPPFQNRDGTRFVFVEIAELHQTHSLLRLYDGHVWATAMLGGEVRLNQILAKHDKKAS